jgi:uncharacterized protein YdhG (YjbR/CyaY superfamily)
MPAFVLDGRPFVWMGAFRNHCSLFPGTIHFTLDEPIPATVVKKLVKTRIAANKARATKKAGAKKAPSRKRAKVPPTRRKA